jgi:uncharacterized protein (TIGR02588 family)
VQDRTNGRNLSAAGPESDRGRGVAEWVTLGVSLAILLGIFGGVSYLYLQGEEQPARIETEANLEDLRFEGDVFYLPVEVVNSGDQTVEEVVVQAELDTGSGPPVSAEITVTFLAGGERAKGTFIFGSDPRQGTLTVQAVSYREP